MLRFNYMHKLYRLKPICNLRTQRLNFGNTVAGIS